MKFPEATTPPSASSASRSCEGGTLGPPKRVLAAVDFSQGSRTALLAARQLATRCHAELHVLHAVDPALLAAAEAAGHDLRAEMLQELRNLESTAAKPAIPEATWHLIAGEPCSVILDIASRECADLIVIGATGLSSVTWPALGGTLEGVLRRTSIPTLVVPTNWPPLSATGDDLSGIGPIIVGVNMTCPAIEGAMAGCALASALQTSALLVHAVAPPQTAARWHEHALRAASMKFEAAKVDFEHVASAIRERAHVPTTFINESGDVVGTLVRVAQQHPRALVVLGRGNSIQAYGPPGSIVARTVLLAHVPVLMHVCV